MFSVIRVLLFHLRMTNYEILAVAVSARHDFETKALELSYLQSLVKRELIYIAESYKDDLTSWIEQTIMTFPGDGCELASAVLLDRLQSGKIIYGRYVHEPIGPHNIKKSHTFWSQEGTLSEHTLIADITADQYGGPPVYVGTMVQPWVIPDWTRVV
jgi:hypothetical protein